MFAFCTEDVRFVLTSADKGVTHAIEYLGEYLNFRVRGTGVTALHVAAARGDMELLVMLLGSDALDVDGQKRNGHTALHCAAARGHLAAVEALLEAGASTAVLDAAGRTALQLSTTSCPKEFVGDEVAAMLVGTALERSLALE